MLSAVSGSSLVGPTCSMTPSRAKSPASRSSRRLPSIVTTTSAFLARSVANVFLHSISNRQRRVTVRGNIHAIVARVTAGAHEPTVTGISGHARSDYRHSIRSCWDCRHHYLDGPGNPYLHGSRGRPTAHQP